MSGRLVDIGDTRLYVEERGDGLPLLVLHGGPGLDHTMFGATLDPLTDAVRLVLVDQRAQGRSDRDSDPATWTLAQMAADVSALAGAMGFERYAVLGHSFGAIVALQHAVDFSGQPVASIISSGVPTEEMLMSHVEASINALEPAELRETIADSWEREASVTDDAEVLALLIDQLPFHFADVDDPRIAALADDVREGVYSAAVLRRFANEGYGGIDVADRLGDVRHPVLVLAGRHDRTCSVAAAEAIAAGIPGAELGVLEGSGHMTFVEENDAYLRLVSDFLGRRAQVFSEDAGSSAHRP
jgi:proline iminopeptidase